MTKSFRPRSPSSLWQRIVPLLLSPLIFVSLFALSGTKLTTIELDPSWQAVMEDAFVRSFQFGSDIVFTYGPYAFLNCAHGEGKLILLRSLGAILWAGMMTWGILSAQRRLPLSAAPFILLWVIPLGITFMDKSIPFLFLMAALTLTDPPGARHRAFPLLLIVIVSFLSLVKFTFFLMSLIMVAAVAVTLAARRRFGDLAACGGAWLLSLTLFWLLAGQRIGSFPSWVETGLQISAGFTDAMSLPPTPRQLATGIATCCLVLLSLFITLRKKFTDVRVSSIGVMLILFLFLSWKHGFVRADGHSLLFFTLAPLLALVPSMLDPDGKLRPAALFLATALVSLMGMYSIYPNHVTGMFGWWQKRVTANLSVLSDMGRLSVDRRFRKGNPQRPPLTQTRNVVGNRPVDVVNFLQAAAIATGMNYHPRPVIQGYSAYTPELQELNLRHYLSEKRPDFVLFNAETIDNRYPTLDDALLIPHLLQNYEPVLREERFILLRHGGTDRPLPPPVVVKRQTVRFGQSFDIPHQLKETPLFVKIVCRETLIGRAIRFLFQLPPLSLRVSDGERYRTFRFVPAMARGGFLLSPILSGNDDVMNFLAGRPGSFVRSFKIVCDSRLAPLLYRHEIGVELSARPGFPRPAAGESPPPLVSQGESLTLEASGR